MVKRSLCLDIGSKIWILILVISSAETLYGYWHELWLLGDMCQICKGCVTIMSGEERLGVVWGP